MQIWRNWLKLKHQLLNLHRNPRLAGFVIFDFVWLSAVLGREQWIWLTALLILLMFAATPKLLWERRYAFLLVLTAGLAAELLTVLTGVISFTGTNGLPPWLILLWVGFTGMSLIVFDWLRGKALLGALFGAIFGPITYFAGTRINAAEILVSFPVAVAVYATMWALLMVLVAKLVTPLPPVNPNARTALSAEDERHEK
ncbi:hypothetical protein CWE08_03725 [Aliidiomarina iranensis]|uniref:DUF2878 domain-containing protein n=1 Tax=Aliidiomarina iranensis TaxID=1434071 RepID=A0A432W112_9GAMM|nr:DUF2878 domain-containing protein [Aliidiomarina iranensis]RUO22668.1 hypothetical protein CWE08_03725 [Aliidiomarina iranensis]